MRLVHFSRACRDERITVQVSAMRATPEGDHDSIRAAPTEPEYALE
jgi:hypothetical protein